jgi:predicted GNAT family acetyltransferase
VTKLGTHIDPHPHPGDPGQLERPTWSALTTQHARFALGSGLARRYPPDISPLSAVGEVSDASLRDLASLLAPGEVVGLFSAEPVAATRDLTVIAHKVVDQMVYGGSEAAPAAGAVIKLTHADVPEMLHLADLTKPGPFAARTIALGSYIGIRNGDQLVAIAGERLRFDGFTEISAVCSHPDHRGRGYSSLLVSTLMRQILDRGDTPFLHVFDDNTRAAALYRKFGFTQRRSFTVTVLRRGM